MYFNQFKICDGRNDCDDGYDESECEDKALNDKDLTFKYRMSRYNRFGFIFLYTYINLMLYRYDDFYDNWDGEWGWFDVNIDEDGEQFLTIEVPETCDDWWLVAFSVSKTYGIAIIEEPVPYGTCRWDISIWICMLWDIYTLQTLLVVL